MVTIRLTAEKISKGQLIVNPAIVVSKQEKSKIIIELGWIIAILGIEISWKNGKE